MTEDALATDRLVTMIQISPALKGKHWDEPVPLEGVGCMGRIIQHERLPDGRFNFLLLGLTRVRINQEINTGKLYRMAEVDVLQDVPATQPEDGARAKLIELFRQLMESHQELDSDLDELLRKEVRLGVLSDLIAYTLNLPPALKQRLLEETVVDRRVSTLCTTLERLTESRGAARPFPPPFSAN
jgi:Lon protease-like protein